MFSAYFYFTSCTMLNYILYDTVYGSVYLGGRFYFNNEDYFTNGIDFPFEG